MKVVPRLDDSCLSLFGIETEGGGQKFRKGLQAFAQAQAGAGETALDGAERGADGRGDFGVVETFDVGHDDDGAKIGGEGIEAVLDGMLEFVGFELSGGSEGGIGQPARGVHFVAIVGFGFEGSCRSAFLAAEFIVAGVGDGAQEPGFERSAAVGFDGAEGGDEGFLRGVGGAVFVTEDAQRGVEDHVLIMEDKAVEGVEVAALGGGDEGGFVHGGR